MAAASYFKTQKGREEIDTRSFGLSAKLRRLLILIDGQKTMESLLQLTGTNAELDVQLHILQQEGFISTRPQAEARATSPSGLPLVHAVKPPEPVEPIETVIEIKPAISELELLEVKGLMLDSAREYLGLMGAELVRSLEKASDERSIRACASRWHLAMRESRHGKEAAGRLFEAVREVLHAV